MLYIGVSAVLTGMMPYYRDQSRRGGGERLHRQGPAN